MDNNAVLAPVEIEELDPESINKMNLNMGEFIEAEAIKIHNIPDQLSVSQPVQYVDYNQLNEPMTDTMTDTEEQNLLSVEEENLITKQFLNGELTFSEFTEKMDQGVEIELEEIEISNTVNPASEPPPQTNSQVASPKPQKAAKSRSRRPRRNLPPALQGLMGEANLRYARGEIELATQICMEIIRQVPNAPEPFHTLASIYENDQPEKAMQFQLIAAHLSPKDSELWVRLATSSLASGNLRQALTCYSKAIQASPKDIELYEIRAKLQEKFGDKKAYIRAYSKLLHQFGPEDGVHIVAYARNLAERCMKENMYEIAADGMDNIFKKCPQLVTLAEVNIMIDILIPLRQFTKCLDILISYAKIIIEYVPESTSIAACYIPADLPVDLKAKCIITVIELNAITIADTLIPDFLTTENPEISGDLFLDIAEAFMNKKEFRRALDLLEPLVNSQNFSLAAVWLRHGECWIGCKDLNKAIKSYEMVRKLSPLHLEARMELAKLYKLKGQFNKAVQVLKQDIEKDSLDPAVIYERTKLLLKVKRYDEFFESGLLLLSRHCITLRSRLELTALSRTSALRQRTEILYRDRLSRGEPLHDENAPTFCSKEDPTKKQEFNLVLQMCHLACKLKKYGLMQRICFTTLTSKRFAAENSQIMYLCLIACIRNNDSFAGFNIVRELVRSKKRSKAWNLLNIIIQRAEDSRHNRFMMRQLGKEDVFSYLHILHANNCLVSGTYKYALNDYISLFKVKPSALLALLVAVTCLQMACQKFSSKKNQLVTQAMAFLKTYMELRGEQGSQEANYNMARALHQLGLLTGAIHFYSKVLELPAPELVEQHSNLLDLKKEAAFNMHLIYMQSENHQLARTFLENYITI
ncbi:general transcription factor 3C polypeptide 3-like isoform X4 [Phymastichus coffea]|nr:general transcription factor 3C polypeptide 3-like isoform X4 [Phymastichus coffea]